MNSKRYINKNMVIGYLTSDDAKDKKSWSGIHYRMHGALGNQGDKVILLGPVKIRIIDFLLSILNFSNKLIFKKQYNKTHNLLKSYYFAFVLKRRIKKEKIDVIFVPSSSTELAKLNTDIPICYLSGSSFNQLQNYYSNFTDICKISVKESNIIEQSAINKSITQVYPSIWAAKHAEKYYNANNTYVVKYGANIIREPDKNRLERDYNSSIKLLFIGVEWIRKGGEIVIDAINILNKKGYDFELTICGCNPILDLPVHIKKKITIIPFLNKNKPKDNEIFEEMMYNNHILFLPTRAECFGVVFCEASAYGIPSVTTDTGGVSAAIENNVNGYLLQLSAKADLYAEKIEYLINNKNILKEMSAKARKKYEIEMNWENWGKKMKEILLLTKNNHQ